MAREEGRAGAAAAHPTVAVAPVVSIDAGARASAWMAAVKAPAFIIAKDSR